MGSTPWYDYLIGGGIGGPLINDITKAFSPVKSPASTAPTAPSQAAANTSAAATVSDSRAAMLNAGGQTDMTGGLGILTGSDVKSSSLIGG
jgi:hypothetical protein